MLSRLSVVRGAPRSREGAVLRVGMTVFVMRRFGREDRWWRGRIEAVEYNFDPPLVGVAHPPEPGSSRRWSSSVSFQDCSQAIAVAEPTALGGAGAGGGGRALARGPSRPPGARTPRALSSPRQYRLRSVGRGGAPSAPGPGAPRSREGVALAVGMPVRVLRDYGPGARWWGGTVTGIEPLFCPPLVNITHARGSDAERRWGSTVYFSDCPRLISTAPSAATGGAGGGSFAASAADAAIAFPGLGARVAVPARPAGPPVPPRGSAPRRSRWGRAESSVLGDASPLSSESSSPSPTGSSAAGGLGGAPRASRADVGARRRRHVARAPLRRQDRSNACTVAAAAASLPLLPRHTPQLDRLRAAAAVGRRRYTFRDFLSWEIFSGAEKSMSMAANVCANTSCMSVDIRPEFHPDLCVDFLDWDLFQFIESHYISPDGKSCSLPLHIHFSPDCQTMCAIAGMLSGRVSGRAGADAGALREAFNADACVWDMIKLIELFLAFKLGVTFTIENPAGSYLWKMPAMERLFAGARPVLVGHVVNYCMYGRPDAKPTRIAASAALGSSWARRCTGTGACGGMTRPGGLGSRLEHGSVGAAGVADAGIPAGLCEGLTASYRAHHCAIRSGTGPSSRSHCIVDLSVVQEMSRAWSARERYQRAAGAPPRCPATGTSTSAERGGLPTPVGSPDVWESDWSSSDPGSPRPPAEQEPCASGPPSLPSGLCPSCVHSVLLAMGDAALR